MSFDKDYPNRKDRRQQYHKSKAIDRSCRPGGGCPYCKANRQHKNKIQEEDADNKIIEYFTGDEMNIQELKSIISDDIQKSKQKAEIEAQSSFDYIIDKISKDDSYSDYF